LSNWYVRRNRRRFWKGEHGRDKDAAYQTLYTVLSTLTKLLAPVMPFLTETMYRNLRTAAEPVSIHLCSFPEVDSALIDEQLSQDMEALFCLVTLGSAARNTVKAKVRQPLAELKVLPGGEAERRALGRFADQIRDELNLKRVTLHEPSAGPLLRPEVKPNLKTLGTKFRAQLKEVQAAIASAPAAELAALAQKGEPFQLAGFTLDPGDVVVTLAGPEGWVGAVDRCGQAALDARITEELAREGMARDVVRLVQEQRKKADLEMEDRIVLRLETESAALKQAIDAHRDYIAAETLVRRWADGPLNGEVHRAAVKVDKDPLTIELARATA
jgi:isoleucyl-tRNA synthetase